MQDDLKAMLEFEVEHYGIAGHPALLQRFVLKEGRRMTAAAELPEDVERGPMKQCFMNATHLMQIGYQYVEGFVLVPNVPIVIHHAWVLDTDGNVIDNTLRNPAETQYYGVEFDEEEVFDQICKSGVYGILSDGMTYNSELMFSKCPELQDVLKQLNLDHQTKFR